MTDSSAVEVSVHIAAPPETVFAYFTDPAQYVQWMGARATLEAVPGGVYQVTMRDGVTASGRFVEVDPPHRLVFTWGWDRDDAVPPGSTRVVVTFDDDRGGTRVVLRHYDLPSDGQRDHHRGGWEVYLSRLATRVATGDAGPDPTAGIRPASGS